MSDTVEVLSTGEEHDNDDVLVDDTEDGVVLLSENPSRKSALVINLGPGAIRVTTDGSIPTATHGKPLGNGDHLLMFSPYCSTGEVRACRQDTVNATVNASEVD